jgi:hypothetical protein
MKLNPFKITLFVFGTIIFASLINSTVLRAPGAPNATSCERSCDGK